MLFTSHNLHIICFVEVLCSVGIFNSILTSEICNGHTLQLMKVMQGLSLELCAKDRVGLLSDVTRVLRENGLSVMRAGITTVGDQAIHVFYVSDAAGNPVDMKNIEGLRQEIGHKMMLNVKKVPTNTKSLESSGWDKTSFFFGSLLEKFRS